MIFQIGALTVVIGCLPQLPIMLVLLALMFGLLLISVYLGNRYRRRAAMLERAYVGIARRG